MLAKQFSSIIDYCVQNKFFSSIGPLEGLGETSSQEELHGKLMSIEKKIFEFENHGGSVLFYVAKHFCKVGVESFVNVMSN